MKKNLWIAPIVLITSDSAAAVSIDILTTRHIQGETCSLYLSHKVDAITKKYGYKLKTNYEVYRLDKFSKMYYKNCALDNFLPLISMRIIQSQCAKVCQVT